MRLRSEGGAREVRGRGLDEGAVGYRYPARVVVERLGRDDDRSGGEIGEGEERVAPRGRRDAGAVGEEEVQPSVGDRVDGRDRRGERVAGGGAGVERVEGEREEDLRVGRAFDTG